MVEADELRAAAGPVEDEFQPVLEGGPEPSREPRGELLVERLRQVEGLHPELEDLFVQLAEATHLLHIRPDHLGIRRGPAVGLTGLDPQHVETLRAPVDLPEHRHAVQHGQRRRGPHPGRLRLVHLVHAPQAPVELRVGGVDDQHAPVRVGVDHLLEGVEGELLRDGGAAVALGISRLVLSEGAEPDGGVVGHPQHEALRQERRECLQHGLAPGVRDHRLGLERLGRIHEKGNAVARPKCPGLHEVVANLVEVRITRLLSVGAFLELPPFICNHARHDKCCPLGQFHPPFYRWDVQITRSL
mmetsp:Transcript_19442/g.54801  ORF Transcript_19442/g.54801 Transcript_19442/m.54801 type:complete len:301 (-) Transcript_19442:95-997(-)